MKLGNLLLFCSISFAVCAQTAPSSGLAVYKARCAVCHGADATGNTTMGKQLNAPDLHSTDVQKLTVAEMARVVTEGKDPMPSFQDQLSPDEIAKVVAYVRTLNNSPNKKKK